MYNRKWKPNQNDFNNFKEICETFKNDINKIEKDYFEKTKEIIIITINQKCNSIYFTYKNENYRISLHSKIDKGIYNNFGGFDGKNQQTNSRTNILKLVKKILGLEE